MMVFVRHLCQTYVYEFVSCQLYIWINWELFYVLFTHLECVMFIMLKTVVACAVGSEHLVHIWGGFYTTSSRSKFMCYIICRLTCMSFVPKWQQQLLLIYVCKEIWCPFNVVPSVHMYDCAELSLLALTIKNNDAIQLSDLWSVWFSHKDASQAASVFGASNY